MKVVTIATLLICSLWTSRGLSCKFPNEGCYDNDECCSGKCIHAHPGTNPRCTKLSIHRPCLYTYQCEDRLKCGSNNKCCAKYWGVCTDPSDCCDQTQLCLEVEGFYYKRCLYTNKVHSGGNVASRLQLLCFITSVVVVVGLTIWR